MNSQQKTLLIISFVLAFVIPIYGLSQSLAAGSYGQTRLPGFTVFVLEAALLAATVFVYKILKEHPNLKRSLITALIVFITPFIVGGLCFWGYVSWASHQYTPSNFVADPAPLKPGKDIYQVAEDIPYGYMTLRIEAVKRLSTNMIEVDLYEYNSKDNPNKLQMFNSQYYLEAPDKTRIEPNFDNGGLRGVDVEPDEAKRGRVLFQNDALKANTPFILKVLPFEGSPALSVDISKYLVQ
ncbi:hypothetical protein HYW46_06515 [Candidatus Daviesbacteria bacterium]|nr:hypothetical protein [Candidatus Daviesbacteria bacterium]